MYNDTIKVANKIITSEDLAEIFAAMQEKVLHYKKVRAYEESQNKMLEYAYQKFTFEHGDAILEFTVNFYDDTCIKFDNYDNFMSIFNTRLDEIKEIDVRFSFNYHIRNGYQSEYYSQHITMWIYEKKMNIDVSLKSNDKIIDDVYELIKSKVLSAPAKYDEVIKKKSSINLKVGFALGMIPGLIISTLLLLIPVMREVFAATFVLYPICVIVIAMFIGFAFGGSKLNSLYKSIQPDQKYAGYDSNKGKSIYKDDIDAYVESSEILIGKNVDNLIARKKIMEIHNKYKKYLMPEFGILLVLSIIVLFLG